jgi:S-DNA-T family DNA segregation ATPase FtsK/SpoIIIE
VLKAKWKAQAEKVAPETAVEAVAAEQAQDTEPSQEPKPKTEEPTEEESAEKEEEEEEGPGYIDLDELETEGDQTSGSAETTEEKEKQTTSSTESEDDGVELSIAEAKQEAEGDSDTAVGDENYDPTLDLPDYQYPTLDLLEKHGDGEIEIDKEELAQKKEQIVETLSNYKIKIDKIKATIGPTITLYEIVPEAGTRISKIRNLEDDIALSLSALGIRIIAPIPGKGTIGIEVPNKKKHIVSSRSVLASKKFQQTKKELPITLGKTIANENFIADLAQMPHLLVAGATGQGKSVGINAFLLSLLYKKHPSQLKFVLIDPKKVELSLYNIIKNHFLVKLPN